MKNKTEKIKNLEKYLIEVENKNNENEKQDIRLKFFYSPKLNKILLLKKINTCGLPVPVSKTTIHLLESPFDNNLEEKINESNLKKLVLNYLDSFVYDDIPLAEMHDTTAELYDRDGSFLEYLKVDKMYRGAGLARKLINTLRASTINNGETKIHGHILPLDNKAYVQFNSHRPTPLYQQIINYLARNKGLFKEFAYVDYEHLTEIYSHLGFAIDESTRDLLMTVNPLNIPLTEKLPKSFTSFDKNPETLILF